MDYVNVKEGPPPCDAYEQDSEGESFPFLEIDGARLDGWDAGDGVLLVFKDRDEALSLASRIIAKYSDCPDVLETLQSIRDHADQIDALAPLRAAADAGEGSYEEYDDALNIELESLSAVLMDAVGRT